MTARRCGLRVIRCAHCGGETTLWAYSVVDGASICLGCSAIERRKGRGS